jgi:hypothetical protein
VTTSFRRVVIALGASRGALAQIATWATLARRLEAELSGLFVEDVGLLHLAGLPFASVVGLDSVARSLDPPTVERMLRRASAEARAALEVHATRQAVAWSFKSVRGHLAREILANVARDDLVVLEASGLGEEGDALAGCAASVLYLRPEVARGRAVVVLVAGADDPLLAPAAHLAAASARRLDVILEQGGATVEHAVHDVLARLLPAALRVPVRILPGDGERAARIVRQERGAILVSSGATAALARGAACSLLRICVDESSGEAEGSS